MIDLYLFILIPIFIATFSFVTFSHKIFQKTTIVLQSVFLIMASVNFWYIKYNGTVIRNLGGWERNVGITLRADLLSSMLVMLTIALFLSAIFFNYSKNYVDKQFLFLFLILQALVCGIFLSNDLFNIFILIEISTIVVSILIMYKKDGRSIYDGMIYLLMNIVAATFLLFGIAYVYKIFGVLDLGTIAQKIVYIENPATAIIPYSLIITAVGLKSALMPLFSWLPKAHGTPSAPTIVSAILSGLYVKGGVYLFIRVQDAFGGVLDTTGFFLIMGFLTGLIGFFLALCQSDIKLILAYHTISQIGLIMIGLNSQDQYAYWGAVYHIINHAFFKSVLFLTAGMIIEEYKTRNLWQIKGVFYKMPVVGITTILAVLGITGAPLFNGSVSKYFIQSGLSGNYMEYGLLLINLGTIISFVKYSSMLFGDKNTERVKIDPYRKAVIIILSAACFFGGIFGQKLIAFFFNMNFTVDFTTYMQKTAVYFISLITGVIIYKKIIEKSKLLTKIGSYDISFNNACISIVAFCAIVMIYLAAKYIVFI